MKRNVTLIALLFLLLCASCSPAGSTDTTTPLLLQCAIGIIVIIGVVIFAMKFGLFNRIPGKKIHVIINPQRKRVQATEQTTQLSPEIEHVVNLSWGDKTNKRIDIGFQNYVNAAILEQIEKTTSHSFKQKETLSQTVNLNGDTSSKYRLVWTDIIIEGTVEYITGSVTHQIPFQFTEKSELVVNPL
jgi:hypothetical protein